eukprot:114901-Pelagomonas_calceolata.AAC.5
MDPYVLLAYVLASRQVRCMGRAALVGEQLRCREVKCHAGKLAGEVYWQVLYMSLCGVLWTAYLSYASVTAIGPAPSSTVSSTSNNKQKAQ